jgi:LPS-assembly lipoprotein
MTARLQRRRMLALTASATLSGCGFQPIYMPTASGNAGVAQREMAAIEVTLMPGRPGQVLRQALQDRLAMGASGVARRYELTASFGVTGEGIAILPDSTSTRVRLIGSSTWTLVAQNPARTTLTTGSARAVDAYNVIGAQYFGADLENEAIAQRIANALADQITLQLATFFRKRAAAPA